MSTLKIPKFYPSRKYYPRANVNLPYTLLKSIKKEHGYLPELFLGMGDLLGYLLPEVPAPLIGYRTFAFVMAILGIFHPSFLSIYVYPSNWVTRLTDWSSALSRLLIFGSFLLFLGALKEYDDFILLFEYIALAVLIMGLIILIINLITTCWRRERHLAVTMCLLMPLLVYPVLMYTILVNDMFRLKCTYAKYGRNFRHILELSDKP